MYNFATYQVPALADMSDPYTVRQQEQVDCCILRQKGRPIGEIRRLDQREQDLHYYQQPRVRKHKCLFESRIVGNPEVVLSRRQANWMIGHSEVIVKRGSGR